MSSLVKSGTTLLVLTAVVGLAGGVAAEVVDAARTTLNEQWADLGDLQTRWADLGVPTEITAPVAAIPRVANQTLELPRELTETASDILSTAELDETETMSETLTTGETITPTGELVAASSKVVALGPLEKNGAAPTFVFEKAGVWEQGDSFYVRIRFVDSQGEEAAFCTHLLDAAGDRQYHLDLGQVEALPAGWRGTALATVHDGVQDGPYELSGEHQIDVRMGNPAVSTDPGAD
jgi:hypothetical protein